MSQLVEEAEPTDKKIKLDSKVEVKIDSNGNANEESTTNSERVESPTSNLISENSVPDHKKEENAEQPMSKSRKKKLLKLAKWEIKKIEKRKQEREKQRLKKQEAREKGVPYRTGPSRKSLKHVKMANSSCRVTVAIDLSFDHLMIDKVNLKDWNMIYRKS